MEMEKPKPKPKPKKDVLRLPPGFRFHPTDEELVVHYLSHKVHSSPNLPLAAASVIADADLCKSDPWDLPGDWEQERFFFGTKEIKYPNGNRSNRATRSGYWKATGLDKQIVAAKSKEVVGMKKTLVFYKGKPPASSRTDWIMHEYRLVQTQEKWVLCRIFLKKRGKKEEEAVVKPAIFYDFLQAAAAPEPVMNLVSYSSSGSSGITEADASSASVAAYDQDSSS